MILSNKKGVIALYDDLSQERTLIWKTLRDHCRPLFPSDHRLRDVDPPATFADTAPYATGGAEKAGQTEGSPVLNGACSVGKGCSQCAR